MSFWTDLETALATTAKSVVAELSTIATNIKPLIEAGAEEIATVALNAVAQQAPLVLTGQEKLSNATSAVITTLATQGKSVAASVAEASVQSAYNTLSALLNKKTS